LEDAYVERIAVQSRGTVRIVSVEEITHITADGSYAELHTGEETHLIRERMKTLEERLHPEAFMRIHRSTIVRLDEVDAILRGGGGDYAVRLEDGTRLSLSRGRIDALKERLGVAGL
jgi:two-component system LytT family response regulator